MKAYALGTAVALSLAAGAAGASTVTFDGSASYSLGNGITVTVTGHTYSSETPLTLAGATLNYNGGFGVSTSGDPKLDSAHQELLLFTFTGGLVNVNALSFAQNDQNDHVDYFFDGTIVQDDIESAVANAFLNSDNTFVSTFAIGLNFGHSDQLRVAGFNYTLPAQVPVPAAGLLLAGGLGALAAIRRRRKS